MGGSRAKSRFLRTVGAVGILAMFEIETDLIKAFFAYEIFPVGTEVPAVDDRVDEFIGVRAQITTAFDTTNTFKTKGVPDSTGSDISFVDEIENRVRVALANHKYTILA